MAKAITLAEALEVLAQADTGFTWTKAQQEVISGMVAKTFESQAMEILLGNGENLPGKLNEKNEDVAQAWVNTIFNLAKDVTEMIEGTFKTVQGGALRKVHVIGVDTPHGHLKVELRSAE